MNDVPGLFQVTPSQFMEDEYKRYVGATGTVVVGTDNGIPSQIPGSFSISQNYPNPFNPVTALSYDLPDDGFVNITIHDIAGRRVKTLVNAYQLAGFRSTQWNATSDAGAPVSAGLYLYTIQAGDFRQTKKMLLLK